MTNDATKTTDGVEEMVWKTRVASTCMCHFVNGPKWVGLMIQLNKPLHALVVEPCC